MKYTVLGNSFEYICEIRPLLDPRGTLQEYLPQARYDNHKKLPLHKYGKGPFCKFNISKKLAYKSGVYLLVSSSSVLYVGECVDLAERFNQRGYGNISPRNCYKDGQQTNCRINSLILQSVSIGRSIELFFLGTSDHKKIETLLMNNLDLPWNR